MRRADAQRARAIDVVLDEVPQVDDAALLCRRLSLAGEHAADHITDALGVALVLEGLAEQVGQEVEDGVDRILMTLVLVLKEHGLVVELGIVFL